MNKVAVCVLLVAILASASSKALTRTQLRSFYSNIPEEGIQIEHFYYLGDVWRVILF